MKRLTLFGVLTVVGLGLTADTAAAQNRSRVPLSQPFNYTAYANQRAAANSSYGYTTRYNPSLGGYTTNSYQNGFYGGQQVSSFYNPYTGFSTGNYNYATPYNSGSQSYGYDPFYGTGYYKQFNATPFGYSAYGYRY